MFVKIGSFPPGKGENKKYLSCHHLVVVSYLLAISRAWTVGDFHPFFSPLSSIFRDPNGLQYSDLPWRNGHHLPRAKKRSRRISEASQILQWLKGTCFEWQKNTKNTSTCASSRMQEHLQYINDSIRLTKCHKRECKTGDNKARWILRQAKTYASNKTCHDQLPIAYTRSIAPLPTHMPHATFIFQLGIYLHPNIFPPIGS